MNTVDNNSTTSNDGRSIQQIIFEKANFGAVPVGFRLAGDPSWHPVAWTKHEKLCEIQFTDGSSITVNSYNYAPKMTPELSDKIAANAQAQTGGISAGIAKGVDDYIIPSGPLLGGGFPGNDPHALPDHINDALDGLGTDAATQVSASLNEPDRGESLVGGVGEVDEPRSLLRPATKPPADADTTRIADKFKPKGHA